VDVVEKNQGRRHDRPGLYFLAIILCFWIETILKSTRLPSARCDTDRDQNQRTLVPSRISRLARLDSSRELLGTTHQRPLVADNIGRHISRFRVSRPDQSLLHRTDAVGADGEPSSRPEPLGLRSVELVMNRAASAKLFDLPPDRIWELVVISDRGTVLGKSKATLDLSELGGMRLRSHGGLADRNVYLIFSRPLNDKYAEIALSRQLRNFDVFEFVLNGLR